MKTFLKSLRYAWEYLTHPYETTDKLIEDSRGSLYSWIFLLFSLVLWTFTTGYQNLVVGETSRARELKLGISMGPDLIITLLTIPLGIAVIWLISLIVTRLIVLLGGRAETVKIFSIVALTLNTGSTFFDLQYEIGATLTGHAWQLHEVPNFFYYTIFIMFAPIVWSLIITILALKHYSGLGVMKTLASFLLGVLPVFLLLIFIVM